MPVKSLQDLCCDATAKQTTLVGVEKLPLPKSLKDSVSAARIDVLANEKIPRLIFKRFDLDYCCVKDYLNPFDPITNAYFKALYDEHVKSHVHTITYCEESGYGLDLYAPEIIQFRTHTGDLYTISYGAYTSNQDSDSNWNRIVSIYRITYRRNNEPPKRLKFMFVNGGGCNGLVAGGLATPYTMSYIALNNDMNYMGHYFKDFMFENYKHEQKFTKQLSDLIDKNKTSPLPFFVHFLDYIPDPIMRLIYLFTYMPSVRVVSGK